jgi:membrane protein DedA with SNARE-associated domain
LRTTVYPLVSSPTPDKAEAEPTDDVDRPERPRPSRRAVTFVAIPLIVLVLMTQLAGMLWAGLADTHPAWLLALSARNRNLVLTTNDLDPWTYYGIGMVRLLAPNPLFYLLGYWYGDAAITWMERRTRSWGELLRSVEGWFDKARYPLVFLFPGNNYICLLAGAARMRVRAFVVLTVVGCAVRLYVFRVFGDIFQEPIDDVLGWIADYRMPLLIASIVLVLLSVALEAKKGETEVESLAHLDDEITAADQDEQEEERSS